MARYEEYSGLEPGGTITMEWSTFFMVFGSSVMNGVVLIGVAEVIRLLHKIYTKEPIKLTTHSAAKLSSERESVITGNEKINTVWKITREDEEKIYELFSGKAILEIRPANIEGNCVVKVQDTSGPLNPEVKVVDISSFNATEVQDTERRNKILSWYHQQ